MRYKVVPIRAPRPAQSSANTGRGRPVRVITTGRGVAGRPVRRPSPPRWFSAVVWPGTSGDVQWSSVPPVRRTPLGWMGFSR